MKHLPHTIALFMLLTACNPINHSANGDTSQPSFFNETSASSSALKQQWTIAQHTLAEQPIDLNIATRFFNPAVPPRIIPPDPRALSIFPHGVRVVSIPDIPISQLTERDPKW